MSGGEVAGTEQRCETRGLSDSEMMMSFKGRRHLTGTWEPVYLSCTVHTGMLCAKSPDLMGPHTAPCPPAPAPGFHSLWTPARGTPGSDGRLGKWGWPRGKEGL